MRAWVALLMAIPSLAQAPSLQQVMRGVLLPNSNAIFSVQSNVPKDDIGWRAVESAAMNIEGAANLILMPRVRSNGQAVPVQSADYIKFARALVPAGAKCLKAAKARSLDAIGDCTDLLSDTCDNCHKVYRDKP